MADPPPLNRDCDIYCPQCSYNLRGLVSGHCPECGLDVSSLGEGPSAIPWVHRRTVGRWRAYWRTVWMVMFRTPRFLSEMARPVSEPDARSFRRFTLLLAYAPMLVAFGARMAFVPREFADLLNIGGPLLLIAMLIAPLVALISITAVPYYTIRHREIPIERQLRAATLSLYAIAPLSLMALPALGVCFAFMNIALDLAYLIAPICFATSAGLLLILGIIFVASALRIVHGAFGGVGSWRVNARILFFWPLCAVLSLIGIPAAVAYVIIIWLSLS